MMANTAAMYTIEAMLLLLGVLSGFVTGVIAGSSLIVRPRTNKNLSENGCGKGDAFLRPNLSQNLRIDSKSPLERLDILLLGLLLLAAFAFGVLTAWLLLPAGG